MPNSPAPGPLEFVEILDTCFSAKCDTCPKKSPPQGNEAAIRRPSKNWPERKSDEIKL
jgi:hypothetical protein